MAFMLSPDVTFMSWIHSASFRTLVSCREVQWVGQWPNDPMGRKKHR